MEERFLERVNTSSHQGEDYSSACLKVNQFSCGGGLPATCLIGIVGLT